MARQWRIVYKDAVYHVMSRGNQRQFIFQDDKDRYSFLDILSEATERFSIEIYAYVLMDNHYHLLIKTREPNLSKTMQWIGTTYTSRYNIRHKECGHLFQGRFKSIIVENNLYLLQLSFYIHRNPLRAQIVDRLADYSWSSFRAYAYKKGKQDWLNTDFILSQVNSQDKHRSYRLKAQRYSDEHSKIWEDVKHGLIYGSDDFRNQIKKRFLKGESDVELPQFNHLRRDADPAEILKQASAIFGYNVSRLTKTGRLPIDLKENRDMLIYYLKIKAETGNRKIGEMFAISYSAVSKVVSNFRKQIRGNSDLGKRYQMFISQFKV